MQADASLTAAAARTRSDLDLSIMLGRLEEEAAAVAGVEHLVESNEGTFSAREALAARGTGDPAFSNWRVYMTVGGARRVEGDPDGAPGRARQMYERLEPARKQLAAVRADIAIIRAEWARRDAKDRR